MSLVALGAYSQKENLQDNKAEMKLDEHQKAELRKAEKDAAAKKVETMIVSRQFIIEVSSRSDQSRAFSQSTGWSEVSSLQNYIAINIDKISLLMERNSDPAKSLDNENFSRNGTFTQYELTKMPKSEEGYIIRFHTDGRIGSYDITMNVSPSGKADLKMEANNGVTLYFRGVLVSLDQSRIKPSFI
jgi:hypothetical protein